jgi:hypothetical protein
LSKYDEDETEAGKQKWIAETLDIRREAVDLLSFCASHGGVSNYQTVRVPSPVKELHAAVLAYSDQIRPKRAKLRSELWDKRLNDKLGRQVLVPKKSDDGYFVGKTDMHGEVQQEDLLAACETEEREVNPKTLSHKWRADNQVTLTKKIDDGGQIITERETYSVYLPPAASSLLISHFDECLDDMDWLPGGYSQHDGVMDPEGDIHIID